MDVGSSLNAILASAVGSHARRLVRLDKPGAHFVLSVSAFMKRSGEISGAEQHRLLHCLLGTRVRTEGDLHSWMREFFPDLSVRLWGTCRKQADKFAGAGVEVFALSAPVNFALDEEEGRQTYFRGDSTIKRCLNRLPGHAPPLCSAKAR